MSLWSLCDEVKRDIHKKVEYADAEWGAFGGGSIPCHFQGFYGVSKGIPSKQFIRSLFLVFREIASAERVDDDEDAANKRARLSPIDEVSVGKAKSLHFKISLVGQVSLVAYPSTFRTGVVGQICVPCSCRAKASKFT